MSFIAAEEDVIDKHNKQQSLKHSNYNEYLIDRFRISNTRQATIVISSANAVH